MNSIRLNFLVFSIILLTVTLSFSQKAHDRIISINTTHKNLLSSLYEIHSKEKITFLFHPEMLPVYELTENFENQQLWLILKKLFYGTRLMSLSVNDSTVAIVPIDVKDAGYIKNLQSLWSTDTYRYPFDEKEIKASITIGNSSAQNNQNTYAVKLIIMDINEVIAGASLYNKDFSITATSDTKGEMNLNIPYGLHSFTIKYTGYKDMLLDCNVVGDGKYTLELEYLANVLEEVKINASRQSREKVDALVGIESIDVNSVQSRVQALGEADVLKSLETLPGVSSNSEASMGFNVRGGAIDENLILWNNAVIFNPTHLMGLNSAFNVDALQNVTLYKGYMDPQFGGWTSSVLDIKGATGNNEHIKTKGSIGTAVGKILVEGPIGNNFTFVSSYRKSYTSWLVSQVYNKAIANSDANFYDLSFSGKIKLNNHHFLNGDFYQSNDGFNYNKEFGYEWGNNIYGVSFNSNWGQKLNSKIFYNLSKYTSLQNSYSPPGLYEYQSGIASKKLGINVNYTFSEKLWTKLGFESILIDILPENIRSTNENGAITPKLVNRNNNENTGLFNEWEFNFNKKLKVNGGIRWSFYSIGGSSFKNVYRFPQKLNPSEILYVVEISKRQPLANFIEPRINIQYSVNPHLSIKTAYVETSQNLHFITVGNTTLPTDFWIGSDFYIKPKQSQQFSLGISTSSFSKDLIINFELYTKKLKNNLLLNNFAQVNLTSHIETEVQAGKGKSYGLELSLDLKKTRHAVYLSYTYSRSKVLSLDQNNIINNLKYFNADNDIPHQLNMQYTYFFTPMIKSNLSFAYKSGRPVSVPESVVLIDNYFIPLYSQRNDYRLPHYLRMDYSITVDFKQSKSRGLRSAVTLAIYNIMSKNNAQNVFFRKSEKGNIKGYQLSIIGAAIPSLSWSFIF